MKDQGKQIEDLTQRIRILENENLLLSERAEDTLLLGLFSEIASHNSQPDSILSALLERVSILKDINFCCCGILEENQFKSIVTYFNSFDKDPQYQLSISASALEELKNGALYLEKDQLSEVTITADGEKNILVLNQVLIFPFHFKMDQSAIFIYGNNYGGGENSLKHLLPLLQQITYIAEDRINTIHLLEELRKVNSELESRVATRTKELELSEERYRGIYNNANDAIILWESPKGHSPTTCMDVNDMALELTGYPREEFLKLSSADLRDPDSEYDPKPALKALNNSGKSKFEVTMLAKDGRKIPTEASVHNFQLHGKDVILAIHRDISERKEFEKQLIVEKNRAEESDKLKSIFLANMSHEIRTPMNAIMGFTELLQIDGTTDEDRESYIKIIHYKGEQLLSLINDILYLSKIEANQVEIKREPCDLNKFFKMAKLQWQNMLDVANKSNIELIIQLIPNERIYVSIDELRISQVLNNLVSNAIKFTDAGFIRISCILESNSIRFLVEDSGIGISRIKHQQIFERFRQAEEGHTRKYGGTGLGLSICKQLVQLMGGEIDVDSVEGEGAKFSVSIPLNLSEVKRNGPVIEVNSLSAESGADILKGKTILIVEDDQSNFDFLEAVFLKMDCHVLHAMDGEVAVEMVSDHTDIDMILMDLQLPNMNGIEASECIKGLRRDIPIIAHTAINPDDIMGTVRQGCIDDYIYKPIGIELLMQKMIQFI